MESDDVPAVVRKALFGIELSDTQINNILDHVFVERLLKAIESHLDDDEAKFRNWFLSEIKHSFDHIAAQKRAEGGPLDRDLAKQLVLGLVWCVHTYVGDCVHCQMRAIQNAVQPAMNSDEATLFEAPT